MKTWLLIICFVPAFAFAQNSFKNIKSTVGKEDQVTELTLSGKKLTKLPEELMSFSNLQKLSIRRSNLDTLPEWLSQLPITELRIVKSRLQYIPPVIYQLNGLTTLDLGHNYISEVPSEIAQLKKLEKLNLWGNSIYDLPIEITEMTKLKNIDLRVIDLNRLEQIALREKFPNIKLEMSPPCNCM